MHLHHQLPPQAAAAQVLIDGIDLFEDDSSPQETPVPTPGPTPPSHTSPPVKVIIGSTIGGLVFLMLLGAAVYFFLCRHREETISSSNTTPELSPSIFLLDPEFEVTPFVDSRFDITPFVWDPYINANDLTQRPPHWHTKDRSIGQGGQEKQARATAEVRADPTWSVPQVPAGVAPVAQASDSPTPGASEAVGEGHGIGSQLIVGTSFPDMVRMVYQRMWQNDGRDNPPDYRSRSGRNED
ncbi:hypothetical protein Moror_13701 [Moniliophthora roreri MCA 2997]|uniref:Transmembrane protein n=2 Tax=Moniliophthora roreri TaxID=221103 RepID=V2YFC9_MONRO|nr:hypothetical protein Moror_13701 [Moniliophthora roreri MCA 2997]